MRNNIRRNSDVSKNIVTEVEEEGIGEDPLCINDSLNQDLSDQDNMNEGNNLNINNMDEEVNDVIDNIEENVNEVEGNVVGQENINYEALQNLSVDEALAFFSS